MHDLVIEVPKEHWRYDHQEEIFRMANLYPGIPLFRYLQ
jgi:hypothetical protein